MPIINGIEVKDCIHFNPKTLRENCSEQETKKPCGTSPICYYKLLHKAYKNCEHLEQENAALQRELQYRYEDLNLKGFVLMGESLKYWKNLKKEYAELKEKVKIYDNMSEKFRQEALEWQKVSSSYKMDADKYCQALEEIKEYIEICKQARTLNIENLKDRINEVLK